MAGVCRRSRWVMVSRQSTSWMTQTRVSNFIRLKGTLPVMFWRWCTSPWATSLMTAAWFRLTGRLSLRRGAGVWGFVPSQVPLPQGDSEVPEVVAPVLAGPAPMGGTCVRQHRWSASMGLGMALRWGVVHGLQCPRRPGLRRRGRGSVEGYLAEADARLCGYLSPERCTRALGALSGSGVFVYP